VSVQVLIFVLLLFRVRGSFSRSPSVSPPFRGKFPGKTILASPAFYWLVYHGFDLRRGLWWITSTTIIKAALRPLLFYIGMVT
jgi:hypothetical protein